MPSGLDGRAPVISSQAACSSKNGGRRKQKKNCCQCWVKNGSVGSVPARRLAVGGTGWHLASPAFVIDPPARIEHDATGSQLQEGAENAGRIAARILPADVVQVFQVDQMCLALPRTDSDGVCAHSSAGANGQNMCRRIRPIPGSRQR